MSKGTPRAAEWARAALPSLVGALVTIAMLNVAPALPLLRAEMELSNLQASLVLAATLLPHMVIQVPGGSLIDGWGARRCLLLALAVVAVATSAAGAATDFGILLAARAFLGLGTGLAIIAGLVLARELPGAARGRAGQGVYGAMLNVGTLLALLSAPLNVWWGWRPVFLAEGCLVVGLLLLSGLLLPPSGLSERATPAPWGDLLRNRRIYSLAAAHSATYSLFVTLAAWAPSFLQHRYSIDLGSAGILSAWLTISAIAFRAAGGILSPGRRVVILGSASASVALTFLLPLAPSPAVAIAIMFLLGATTSLPFAAIFSSVGLLCRPTAVGRGTGLVSAVSNAGAFLFPPIIGYLLDVTGAFLPGYWSMGAVGLLCVLFAMNQLGDPATRRQMAEVR